MAWDPIDSDGTQLRYLRGVASLAHVDSYLIWADLTALQKLPSDGSPIAVIYERQAGNTTATAAASITTARHTSMGSTWEITTAFVRPVDLAGLTGTGIRRFRIGTFLPPDARKFTARGASAAPTAPASLRRAAAPREEVVLGVIDHGFAFVNKRFCTGREAAAPYRTRIEQLWDQQYGYPYSPPPGATATAWRSVPHFGYGRELLASDIDEMLGTCADEATIYRKQQYEPAQYVRTHATHVMDLAAGADPRIPDPMDMVKIVAVQLPSRPWRDTSGQNLCVHLIDAVGYILRAAAGRRVVINLSDGAYAGPHDGTSLFETALDALLTEHRNLIGFVVSAGNHFDARVHWHRVLKASDADEMQWQVLPDDRTDSHLEIWVQQEPADPARQDGKDLEVTVTAPGGYSTVVRLGQIRALTTVGPEPCACVMFMQEAANGLQGNLVHLALGPTAIQRRYWPLSRTAAPHGVWRIGVRNTGKASVHVHAYVERDDPVLGERGPRRQSHFIHPDYPRDSVLREPAQDDRGNTSPIKRMGSLNNVAMATAPGVVVVGGWVRGADSLAPYSAGGKRRMSGSSCVDLLAVTDEGRVLHGVSASATRSGTTVHMDGTSVAAPHVTRRLLELLLLLPAAATPSAAQLLAAQTEPMLDGRPPSTARAGKGRLS